MEQEEILMKNKTNINKYDIRIKKEKYKNIYNIYAKDSSIAAGLKRCWCFIKKMMH